MGELFDREKIQNKIKKLLALAGNNPNQQEAEAAFLKAQEMLLQYKIEMHEIEGTDVTNVKIVDVESRQAANTPWARHLADIIATNFRTMIYYSKWPGRRSMNPVFFGEQEDAEIACSMYEYAVVWLNKTASNYATMMRVKHGIVKGVKQDFIIGFLKGLEDKFAEQIKSKEQYALVLVVPQKVKEEYSKLNLKAVASSGTIRSHGSTKALQAGYQAGRSFQTNMIGGKQQ